MKSRYNLLQKIKTFFTGEENMADTKRTPNYTDAQVNTMVADYSEAPTKLTVERLARELHKTPRSIIAKLVREGVYQAQPRVTKTGAPIIRKSELVAQIQDNLGVQVPTLEKASKADLERLVSVVVAQ